MEKIEFSEEIKPCRQLFPQEPRRNIDIAFYYILFLKKRNFTGKVLNKTHVFDFFLCARTLKRKMFLNIPKTFVVHKIYLFITTAKKNNCSIMKKIKSFLF